MTFKINKSNIELIHGDCLDVMQTLPPNSVDLIAVDPPYGISQNKWDIVIPFEPMWAGIKRVLKKSGTAVFTTAQPYTSQLIMSNPSWFKYDLIWEKPIGSGQLNINKQPLRVHENLIVFYKKFSTYNEQRTEGTPYKISRKTNKFEGNYGKQRDNTKNNLGYRHARSIIKISNSRTKDGHRTEKPVPLMEYIIKTYSNEGDIVLDFSMGRGSTGVASINLNRNFIGIEKDRDWFLKAEERILNYGRPYKHNKL